MIDAVPDPSSTTRTDLADAMRADWNARAREDAHYYVAFGRKHQNDADFFETGSEQVRGLELELRRLDGERPFGAALEIGCGPGRLMRPLARHFREIHGIDVSDEMVARARGNLRDTPNAYAHYAPDSNLDPVRDLSFDFIYSFAVFQHVPSHAVVMGYLREAAALLQPGGILRAQVNGLPATGEDYTTWSGVRIEAVHLAEFAHTEGLDLLVLEGAGTQYLWVTLRKPQGVAQPPQTLRIDYVTNAFSGERVAPISGRFAALSAGVTGFGTEANLSDLTATVDGIACTLTYLGPRQQAGVRQLNLLLPEGLASGLGELVLRHAAGAEARSVARLIPAPPVVIKLVAVTDGVNLSSGPRIVSGWLKLTVDELADISQVEIRVAGAAAANVTAFRTDPRIPRWEINCRVPEAILPGHANVDLLVNGRLVARQPVEIVADANR